MAASVPIYLSQGGTVLTVGTGGTLDTTNGNVTFGPVAIGPDGVATANIQDDAVTTDKIADGAVTTAKIADGDVTTDKIAALAITDNELDQDAVQTDKIVDQAVTFAKALVFVSTEQTATGMAQNIAHGLGVVPAAVLVVPSSNADIMDGLFEITQGMHTMTNVVVTATADLKYYVMAWG